MAINIAAAAVPAILGKLAKGASTGLTVGKFLDAAIPGKSEQALRQVGKDARDRLSRGQYGMSKAEQEQETAKRLGSVERRGGFGGVNPYQLSKGAMSMGQQIQQKGMQALAKSLAGQESSVRGDVASKSRQMGREQQAGDVNLVKELRDDTQKRTSAIVGELPEEQKKKGLVAYGGEALAAMANKKKQSDDAVMTGIASGTA
mgnify:FL=1|tara:strand:- start:875 stop:1483 length:609 start_codon:yes stop_codon:yes gene_type:complete